MLPRAAEAGPAWPGLPGAYFIRPTDLSQLVATVE